MFEEEETLVLSSEEVKALSGKKLDEAVESLMEWKSTTKVEASRTIYSLISKDDLYLEDPTPPMDLLRYLLSLYSWWFWAIAVGITVSLLSIYVIPQSDPWIYIRYVSGAVYVLYLPGAAFIEALYPQRDELEDLERFALSIGLSIALVPLTGLVLNYTPWGIRLNPIFISLTLLTITMGLIGVYRKHQYHRMRIEQRNSDHAR